MHHVFPVAEGFGSQSSAYRRSDVWCVLIGLLASHGADAPITAHHAEGRWNRIHSHGCLSQLQISFLSFARPEIGWVFSFINYGVGPLSFLSLSLLHFSRRRKDLLCREIWRWTIVDFFVPWSSRSMDWFFCLSQTKVTRIDGSNQLLKEVMLGNSSGLLENSTTTPI